MKIQKIIGLIKQSYDQPLLFHKLHNHLTHSLGAANPMLETSDDWSKILIYSAVQSKHPNQALEAKMLALLKNIRPPLESKGCGLKLWIILYYMRNRPCDQMNNLIIFELVNNFMEISPFVDGFIISIVSLSVLGPTFGLAKNKKMRDDSVVHLLSIIKRKPLMMLNSIRALPCYINHDVQPPTIAGLDIQSDILTLQALEHVCFYAKYAKNVEFVKAIVPENPLFVEHLKRFISKSFETDTTLDTGYGVEGCVMEDFGVLDGIRRAYELSSDKKGFVIRIMDFVNGLK